MGIRDHVENSVKEFREMEVEARKLENKHLADVFEQTAYKVSMLLQHPDLDKLDNVEAANQEANEVRDRARAENAKLRGDFPQPFPGVREVEHG